MTNAKANPKKVKLVRDSFSLPKSEYTTLEALKKRAMTMGISAKKSELLRAGLMWLNGASDSALKAALTAVPTLKTGRPAAEKTKQVAAKAPVKSAAKTAVKPAAKAPVKKAVPRKNPVVKKAVAKKAPASRVRRAAPAPKAAPAA